MFFAVRRRSGRRILILTNESHSSGKLNPELDPLLYVFSAIGLGMLHMANPKVWSEIFHRPSLGLDAIERYITALLLDGLRNSSPVTVSNQRCKRTPRRQP